jgi:molybdopterin synthase catalytic subunit
VSVVNVPREIRIQSDDFDLGVELAHLRERSGGRLGGVASFVGVVRDSRGSDQVHGLFLEHYPGMTENSISAIIDQAESRWPLLDVVVVHRVGQLGPSEQIVLVVVGAGHRAAAFAACEFIMDYLKTEAVFWKREARGAGEHWIESTAEDDARRRQWLPDAATD